MSLDDVFISYAVPPNGKARRKQSLDKQAPDNFANHNESASTPKEEIGTA